MPHYLPRPNRADWRSRPQGTELTREIAAARNWEGDGPISFDRTGTAVRFDIQHPPVIALFEIVGEWEACESCDSSSGSSSSSSSSGVVIFPDGWCRALAVPVLYYYGDRKWEQETDADEKYIFHPAGYPPNERDELIDAKIFLPRFSVSDQVWCVFNMQSGWWEILHGAEDLWRFELKTDIEPTTDTVPEGGSAVAYLRQGVPDGEATSSGSGADCSCDWFACDTITFVVCDSMGMFEGTGRDSGGKDGRGVGARGVCKWFADSRRWEIIQMECP